MTIRKKKGAKTGKEGKLEKDSAEYKKERDCLSLTFRSRNGERGRCSVFLLKYFYIELYLRITITNIIEGGFHLIYMVFYAWKDEKLNYSLKR